VNRLSIHHLVEIIVLKITSFGIEVWEEAFGVILPSSENCEAVVRWRRVGRLKLSSERASLPTSNSLLFFLAMGSEIDSVIDLLID